jgi:hypothetical protein
MPISLLPFFLGWVVVLCLLFFWRPKAGLVFLGLSAIALVVFYSNSGVEKSFDEQMPYQLVEVVQRVQFTNSHGDVVTGGSSALVGRLKEKRPATVRVSMTCTYDFGKLRAYHFREIDGEPQ